MKKPPSDRDVADKIVAQLNSDNDKARYPNMNIESLLRRARDVGGGPLRMKYLEQAQRQIAKLDPARYARVISQLQSEVLALQGRGGDTKVVHVTPGEIVIPRHLQTPEFIARFVRLAHAHGINPAQFQVGNPHNRINPQTGQPEFQGGQNPYEWQGTGPWGPTTPPPNRLQEWLQPWIGDQNVLHPVTPDQAAGMDNNLLGNYDRANGVAQAIDNGVRAVGHVGMSMLPPPADSIPMPILTEPHGPFDENKKAIDDEIQKRRDQGFWE